MNPYIRWQNCFNAYKRARNPEMKEFWLNLMIYFQKRFD